MPNLFLLTKFFVLSYFTGILISGISLITLVIFSSYSLNIQYLQRERERERERESL